MTIETEELLALSDVMSAKRMREMEDEIFRLESEVQQWKESANSCQMQVSLLREEPNQRMHEGCLVLSYNKLRDALERISDFSLSSTLSAILLHCLPQWATAEDSDKVAKLVTLFPIENETTKVTSPSQQLPKELMSDEAIELKEKLMDGGFIDDNWQPHKLSCTECALLAQCISEKLAISDTWQFFSRLWDKKPESLRAYKSRAFEQRKSLDFQDKLKLSLC
jgi:hypothetical protein